MKIFTNEFNIKLLRQFNLDFTVLCLKLREEYRESYINRLEILADSNAKNIESILIKKTDIGSEEKEMCLWILVKKEFEYEVLMSFDKFERVSRVCEKSNSKELLLASLPKYKVNDIFNVSGTIYQLISQKTTSSKLVFIKYSLFNDILYQSLCTFEPEKNFSNSKKKNKTRFSFKDGVLNVAKKSDKDKYILGRSSPNAKRSTLPFFNVGTSVSDFKGTKTHYLHVFLQDIHVHLSKYIKVEYMEQEYVNRTIKNSHKSIERLIGAEAFNIINLSLNQDKQILDGLEECLRYSFGNNFLDISKNDHILKNKLNIVIVNRKEEYKTHNVSDPYQKSNKYVIQHVYLDELKSALNSKYKNKMKALGNVILTETFIKKEIINNELKLFSLNGHYFENKKFVLMAKRGIKKDKVFVCLTISKNKFKFEFMNEVSFPTENNFTHLGYIMNDKTLNTIVNTNQVVLPDIDYVMKQYNKVENFQTVPKCEFIKAFDYFSCNCPIQYEKKISQVYENIKNHFVRELSAYEIQNILVPLKEAKGSQMFGKFVRFFESKYNKTITPLLSAKEHKERYFKGFVGINYRLDEKKVLYYSVGSQKQSDIKTSVDSNLSKALKFKKVINADENFIDEYFDLLDVSFVRFKQATVVPFPFKYLREYINMQKGFILE